MGVDVAIKHTSTALYDAFALSIEIFHVLTQSKKVIAVHES